MIYYWSFIFLFSASISCLKLSSTVLRFCANCSKYFSWFAICSTNTEFASLVSLYLVRSSPSCLIPDEKLFRKSSIVFECHFIVLYRLSFSICSFLLSVSNEAMYSELSSTFFLSDCTWFSSTIFSPLKVVLIVLIFLFSSLSSFASSSHFLLSCSFNLLISAWFSISCYSYRDSWFFRLVILVDNYRHLFFS